MKHYNYLALSASLLLVACGGGGGDGGGDSSPPSRTIGSISGNVFDAPVSNANVYIWEYDNGQQGRLIASTKTDTSGNYSVSVESASRPVLIRAEGGSYIDPATGQEVSISQEGSIRLDSVANYVEGSQQSVMVTPLTNMAAGLAKHKIREGSSASTAVSQSISAIEGMYGFDVNTTRPIDITNGPQGAFATDGHKYGALLTAYSSYAKDMKIQKNGSENEYSSINLARIQYNDIQLDGKLDGQGKVGNHEGSLNFGAVKVTSELYTKELAKHVMIAANSPELNKSNIQADEFKPFSDKVNEIGATDTSVIPERTASPIDSTPPVASRPKATKNDIIARTGSIEVKLEDEVGVAVPKVVLESYLSGTWSELETCPVGEIGSSYCAIDTTEFQQGLRSSNVKINVNTVSLDDLKMSSGQARLVFYTEDVLGNKIETGSEAHIVSFGWDNQNPIIKVTSEPGIKEGTDKYLLTGTVTEPSSSGVTVTVSFKGATPEGLDCVSTGDDDVCQFSKDYPTNQYQFGTSTKFELTATDAHGNIGRKTHIVTRDAREPKQEISYPQEEVSFVLEDESGAFSKPYPGDFTVSTYNASSVLTAKNYLNIDYQYAANNIRNNVDVNFQSFNPKYLHDNKIPYIKVKVWDDRAPDGVNVGTPANKLTLQVNYSVSKGGQGDYSGGKTITANAYNQQESVTIPHEKINEEEGSQEGEDKWVASMTYYIPFTKDILGDTFGKISESDAQKLVISTTDGSKNVSDPITVYFKTTFNLPTYTVVTPFVGAEAQLQGLESTGFTNIDNCTTTQNYESGGERARDVASCLLRGKKSDFDFLRIKLASPKGKNTYSYNWTDDGSAPEEVNLEDANFGVYFEKPNGSQTFYVTELSTYHTGLFDYRWDNYKGTKNTEVAKSFLAEVNNAVALQKPGSFFGFDPTTTSYATNEMLRRIEDKLSKLAVEYQHRFLAESMANMSKKWPRVSPDVLASKFYEDLRADGKPDGKKGQTVIELDGDELNADVYRTGLAQAYFDLLTGKPWVKDSIAQLFADDISKARPMLGTLDLFGKDGVSIDKYAPDVKLTVAGRTYTDKNQQYVAGNINATLVVSDPSGIKDKDDASTPLTFAPMWYKRSTPNHGELATGISFKAKDKNDGYVKQFDFSVDTASSEHKDKVELAIHTSAMDNQGNGYGYTDDKRKDSLFIDNEPPKVSLIRPSVLNTTTKLTTQLGSDVYLNTNKIVQLEFKVEDTVHDQKDKRALLFKDSTGQTTEFNPDYFNNVGDESFTINLCKKETNCTKPVNPGDGEWKVYVKAIDNLGNEVNEYSTSAPEFIVKIDSIPPEVENRTAEKMLGGNTTLKPAPIWGDHSPGDKLDVRLRIGSGSPLTLGFCSGDDTVPCLEGTQPDVGVKLIADAFTHGQTNTLFYRATDKAYPPNTSERGTIEFQVDKKGPVINFQDPWLVDYVSQKTGVLGAKFSAKFNSVTDDSGVEKISLYQKTDSGETFLKDWTASEWSSSFEGTYSAINDENKIVTDDSNRAKLFVKATDIHGFVSSSNVSNVIIDTQGPSLKLNGHQENDFYVPGYELTIIAEDYDDNGSINSNGVDKDKFEYWIFKGDVAPNGEGTKPTPDKSSGQYKIPLPLNLDTTDEDAITVKLKAQDIRGNVSTVPFKLHIKQTAPKGKLIDVVYANNEPIGIGNPITKAENIKLLLEISDISGISQITGSYHFGNEEAGTTTGEEAGTTLSFTKKGEKQWESVIQSSALAKDGTYTVSIYAYNNAKYLDGGDNAQRIPLKITQTLSVQKQAVKLEVTSPEDFQNFIANGELKVDFNVISAVTPKELQCWVRENYDSNQAPTDNLGATSGLLEGELGSTPSCTVKSVKNFKESPVLIVKTKGKNGAPNVQRFTFKEMDVKPPKFEQKDYLLKGQNVIPASPSTNEDKQLSIQLGFTDEESGVNINTDFRPYLVRINSTKAIKPTECYRNPDVQVTCSYIADYDQFISSTDAEHIFNVKNLSDKAGNTADVSQLSLKLPEGKPTIAITSTENIEQVLNDNTIISGDRIHINLKMELSNGSKLEVLTVKVGDTTYSTANTNHKVNFGAVTKCGENDKYLCAEFNADLSDPKVQSLQVMARAMDVFNLTSNDAKVTFSVDNQKPMVGGPDGVKVSKPDAPGDKVRFTFPITDIGSGLARVTYTVKDLGTFTREEKKGDDPTYFEVEASELANKSELTVTVTAEDKAGNQITVPNMNVNIALPTVKLSFPEDNARIAGGLLVLGRTSQEMTLEVNATSSITAKSYSITLVPVSTGESIEQSGKFVGTSATSTFSFKDTDQGQYMLKVAVTDSIDRTLEKFSYAGNEYGAEGIKSVVDTQDPSVSNLKAEQTTFAPNDNGEYLVEVTANVLDTNLNEVNAELALKAGSDKIRPKSVVKPTDDSKPYVFSFSVPAGVYRVAIKASDLAGKVNPAQEIETEVVAATTPEVKAISAAPQGPIGGNKTTTLNIKFSEKVQDFILSDIKLTQVGGSDDVGTLSELSTTNNIDWTANYKAPQGEDKTITFTLEDDAYQSEKGIKGKGSTFNLEVKGVLPTVKSLSLNPEYADTGDTINVTVEFSQPVSEPSESYLNTTTKINWVAASGESDRWTGTVKVPSANDTDLEMPIVIAGFSDAYKNEGLAYQDKKLLLKPKVTISKPVVSARKVTVKGTTTRTGTSAALTLTFKDKNGTTVTPLKDESTSDGAFERTVTFDALSGLASGSVDVTAVVTNGQNASGEGTTSFILDKQTPTLASDNPVSFERPEPSKVKVMVTFSEKVTKPLGSQLGGQAISWEGDDEAKGVWNGTADISSVDNTLESLPLTIKGYQDESGNPGAENTDHQFALQPVVTISEVTVNAGAVTVKGNATHSSNSATLKLTFEDASKNTVTPDKDVNLSDGAFEKTVTFGELSSLASGSVGVTAVVTNGQNASGEGTTSFTLDKQAPTLKSDNPVSFERPEPSKVKVTVTFSEKVTKPLGSQLGGQAISWEGDDEAKGVWNGTADISSVDNTLESLPLTIKGYQDESGNPGAENTDHQFALQPVVTISEVTVNAGAVTVKGNATHSSNSATLKLTFEDASKNTVTPDKDVNLSDGAFEKTVTFGELSSLASGSVGVTAVVTNSQNASGEGTTSFTLDKQAPTLKSDNPVSFERPEPSKVKVMVTFSEKVTKPLGSQLGGQAISWEGDDEAKGVWNGTADISSVDNTLESLPLTIKGYQDESGNPGAENTDHQFALQPVVTISEVTVNAGAVTVKGNATHSSNSATLKLTFKDNNGATATPNKDVNLSDGAFEQTVTFDDLSGLASGSVDVIAVVTNSQNASGEGTTSFTLDKQAPTLASTNPVSFERPEPSKVKVTVTFSEKVTKPLGSQLGGQAIIWEGDDEAKGVWNGTADISSVDNTLESLPLSIKGFEDASGNPGAENTAHQFALQPVVTISEVTVNAGAVTVKGNATHSSNSATLKLTFEDASKNTVTPDKNVNLSDGAFEQTVTFDDLSGLASGSVDVIAVVTNSQNASGEGTTSFTLDKQAPTLASTNPVSFERPEPSKVKVTVTFSEKVTKPLGSQLGGQAIIWEGDDEAKGVWNGTADISSVDNTLESLPLSIKGFEDASGNPGAENTAHQFALQPVVTISEVTVNAGAVTVKGNATHSSNSATLKLTFEDASKNTVTPDKDVNLSDGAFEQTVTFDDLSGLASGSVDVIAVVTNSQNASGEGTTSFTLDKQAPTLASTNPVSFERPEPSKVKVTVTFSEKVTKPLGSQLGGQAISWEGDDEAKGVWSGTADISSVDNTLESLPLTIKGYQDESGNPGAENTDHQFVLQPVVTISEVTVNAGAVTVKGSATYSSNSATLKLTFKDNNGATATPNKDVNLSDGAFEQTVTFGELSGLASGSVDVTAVVTNSQNASGQDTYNTTL